jgi:hypothetical protein
MSGVPKNEIGREWARESAWTILSCEANQHAANGSDGLLLK